MTKKRKGLNKYQKAAFKAGDHRTRRDDVERYLDLAQSDSSSDRFEAADNLCPCHVRTHIDEVWKALFRLMEDPDDKVRQAAWHTLEDGGIPDDPILDEIFARAVKNLDNEPDRLVRLLIEEFAVPRIAEQERINFDRERFSVAKYNKVGKCDFCGQSSIKVRNNFETELVLSNGETRLSLICERCES